MNKLILKVTGVEPLKKYFRNQISKWYGTLNKAPAMTMEITAKGKKKGRCKKTIDEGC